MKGAIQRQIYVQMHKAAYNSVSGIDPYEWSGISQCSHRDPRLVRHGEGDESVMPRYIDTAARLRHRLAGLPHVAPSRSLRLQRWASSSEPPACILCNFYKQPDGEEMALRRRKEKVARIARV